MQKQFTATVFLLSILAQTTLSANKITLKERRLPGVEPNSNQAIMGAGAFLLGFLLNGMMSEDANEISADLYNPLFFNVVNKYKSKEMELLVFYMKTYQKDLNNACRMIFYANKRNYEAVTMQKLITICDEWTHNVFKLIPMNFKFFNIEFAYKYFYYLTKSKVIPLASKVKEPLTDDSLDEESAAAEEAHLLSEAQKVIDLFFDTTGRVVNEVLRGEDSIIHSKFHLIQRFYGPEFVKIFAQILDENENIVRRQFELDEFGQETFDKLFQIPSTVIEAEKTRIKAGRFPPNRPDLSIDGVSPNNLYRFYGESYDVPVNNVIEMYMMEIA